jgi:hypothetical protein
MSFRSRELGTVIRPYLSGSSRAPPGALACMPVDDGLERTIAWLRAEGLV